MAEQKEANPLDINTYDIASLRRLASVMKIEAQRTWDKDDYIKAINTRRKGEGVCRVVYDESSEIPRGFCRIRLPLTPNGTDTPLTISVNKFSTTIPRNIVVDVPKEIRDQLRASTEPVTREGFNDKGEKVVKTVLVPSQPFEQLGEQVGESGLVKPSNDPKEQRVRERYKEEYGRWPRRLDEVWIQFRRKFVEGRINSAVSG